MNKSTITAIAAAICLSFSAGAMAMSKADHKAAKEKIEAEYKSAKAGCDRFSANENDICMAKAKGTEKVALAELEAAYQPGIKASYNVGIAKAEAAYSVANEKCDDLAGNTKDVCVKKAKAEQTAAKADAKAQMKSADAKKDAAKARGQANKEINEAHQDAAVDKRDADYAVAIEKCDALAGNSKDVCVDKAKRRFGKS
jgi:hypothetical protein